MEYIIVSKAFKNMTPNKDMIKVNKCYCYWNREMFLVLDPLIFF